jgi:hypothetical protein
MTLPKPPRHIFPLLPSQSNFPITTTEYPKSNNHSRINEISANMYQSTFITLLLQFALFSFAMAEETVVASSNSWQYGAGGGVLGFVVLILDIIVWSKSPALPAPPPILFSLPEGWRGEIRQS